MAVLKIKAVALLRWNSTDSIMEIVVTNRAVYNNAIVTTDVAILDTVQDLTGVVKKFTSDSDAITYFGDIRGPQIVTSANTIIGFSYFSTYLVLPVDPPVSEMIDSRTTSMTFDSLGDGVTNKAFTSTEKTKLSTMSGTNTGDQDLSGLALKTTTVNGHALSSNVTVTASDLGLAAVATTGAYSSLTGKPTLATVATTGAYSDLTGTPTIPSVTRTTSSQSLSLVGTGTTGTQIHATKDSTVRFSLTCSTTATSGSGTHSESFISGFKTIYG